MSNPEEEEQTEMNDPEEEADDEEENEEDENKDEGKNEEEENKSEENKDESKNESKNEEEEENKEESKNEEEENNVDKLNDAITNPISALIGGDNDEVNKGTGLSSASELPTDVINDEEERKTLESNEYKEAIKEEEQNMNDSDSSPKPLKLMSVMSQTEETFRITQPPQPPQKEEQIFAKTQPVTSHRSNLNRSARLSQTRRSNYNPDEVSALSTQLVNGNQVQCEDPDLLGASIAEMEEQRDELINTGKYMDSIKYQKAIDQAKTQHLDVIKKQVSQETLDEVTYRKSETQEKYNAMLKDMKEKEDELEEKYNKMLQALKDRQEDEMVKLENEWASEEKRRQYNRSSQRLRILRTQQALLIRTKRFDEAMQVSKIADNLAQKETQQNHAHMLADFNQTRSIIEQRHIEEYNTFLKKYEDKRKELSGNKERNSSPYLNRMTALQREEEIAKEPEKIWAKKRSAQNELTTRQLRKSAVTVKPNVKEFNTLPLPPLPMPATARKSARSNRPQ